MSTSAGLHAIQDSPYRPWTKAQLRAHEAAPASGWTAGSSGRAAVTYRRGTDYVSLAAAAGTIDPDDRGGPPPLAAALADQSSDPRRSRQSALLFLHTRRPPGHTDKRDK